MNTGKEQIMDEIGVVTINGYDKGLVSIEVYINDNQFFKGYTNPKPITSGTLEYSTQKELVTFNTILNPGVHYDKYRIVCLKGEIGIGAVHEHFHKDIIPLSPGITHKVYQNRMLEIETPENSYVFYKKDENDMLNNKMDVKINGETVQHDLSEGSHAGWMYNLTEGDELTFLMDSFTPVDPMSFIVDAQPGPEYFFKERK